MKLIDNLTTNNNHLKQIIDLFNLSDEIIITSPFLMGDFSDFLSEANTTHLKSIHLITTLVPNSFDQIRKINSINSFVEFEGFTKNNILTKVSINNKLHGKIYIFKKEGNNISAIVSSANFTDSGLSRNHEWGIEFQDNSKITELEESIIGSIEYSDIAKQDIENMLSKSNSFIKEQPQVEIRNIELNLTKLITARRNSAFEFDENIDYWLKPIGVSTSPIQEGQVFNQEKDELHFSKQRPNGVKPNDILIAYGVGTSKILSLYKVLSYPESATEYDIKDENWMERWPWYVVGENLTKNFGANWWKNNLQINDLKDEFLRLNNNGFITAVGGKTLGGINFGKDKLKLSQEFAKYILERVMNYN